MRRFGFHRVIMVFSCMLIIQTAKQIRKNIKSNHVRQYVREL